MLSKADLLSAMTRECDICKHLHSKLGPDAWEYRPSPSQRSTLELAQYLSIIGIAASTCMARDDWGLFRGFSERAASLTPEGFPAAMDREKAELEALFDTLDEDTLRTREAPMPGGGRIPLGAALVNGPLKWLAAYKLQLFLYAKATGATQIGTANAWAGIDR